MKPLRCSECGSEVTAVPPLLDMTTLELVVREAREDGNHVRIYRGRDTDDDEVLFSVHRCDTQTMLYPSDPLKGSFMASFPSVGLARGARRFLLLGCGLGATTSIVLAVDPSVSVTVVDIDPRMLELARQWNPSLSNPRVRLVAKDARTFLRESTETFDFILHDAFVNDVPPAHLVTREFFALVKGHLEPDGVFVVNSNMPDPPQVGSSHEHFFSPATHLHSAMLHAGFASVLHNDFFGLGMMMAFPRPTSLEAFRASLSGFVRNKDGHGRAQVMAAIVSLCTFEIPADRRAVRPFSDEWMPARRIHSYTGAYFDELARMPAAERNAALADLDGLAAVSTASLLSYANWPQREFVSYYDFLIDQDGAAYCQAVLAWLAHTPPTALADIARYFVNWATLHAFHRLLPASVAGEPKMVTGLRQLLKGAVSVAQISDTEALAPLREAMDLLGFASSSR